MKITRRQLRRLIEGVLNEMPMLQPELLPPGFYITVEKDIYNPDMSDWFTHADGGPTDPMKRFLIHMIDERGQVKAELYMRYWGSRYCGGTWEIQRAYLKEGAPDGTGPLMYDIAMELAGDRGIMSDRMTTSDDAARVWEYYLDNRVGGDVITKPIGRCVGKWMRELADGRRPEFSELKFIKAPGSPSIIADLGDKIRFS
jgi:hypothetical protein